MRTSRLIAIALTLLTSLSAQAQDLPAALVDFVNVCVLPRLEGRQPDFSVLNERFKPDNEYGTSYIAPTPDDNYSLILSRGENGTCAMSYDVPAASKYGSEFSSAMQLLVKNYYRGQIGPPAEPGSGFTAISMRGPKTSFSVVYSFIEREGNRKVRVYTN